jgi:hypothetical protein
MKKQQPDAEGYSNEHPQKLSAAIRKAMMRRIRNWLCYHNFHSYSKWEAYPHGRITDEMGLQVPGYCELRHCYHCPLSECRMKLRDEIEAAEKELYIEL